MLGVSRLLGHPDSVTADCRSGRRVSVADLLAQPAADDVIYEVQVANDLEAWIAATTFVSSASSGDGTATEVWCRHALVSADGRDFIRLKITLQ
ncbi:MAG: hypothetical protein ACI9UA_004388 [Pseudoalteromonas tetraodonis]|jgi:hypothetical protein